MPEVVAKQESKKSPKNNIGSEKFSFTKKKQETKLLVKSEISIWEVE
jgi:hypothetical protein